MLLKKIDTQLDSMQIYTLFRDRAYSFFLDSGMDQEKLGRYSFIGCDPFLVLKNKGNITKLYEGSCSKNTLDENILKEIAEKQLKETFEKQLKETIEQQLKETVKQQLKEEKFQFKETLEENQLLETIEGNPFDVIRDLINQYSLNYRTEFPFLGGAVGYLGYDMCHHLEKLPCTAFDDVQIPDCYLGFYDGIIIIDHLRKETTIAAHGIRGKEEEIVGEIHDIIMEGEKAGVMLPIDNKITASPLQPNFTQEAYIEAVNKIREYIHAGDIYQANMTQRFECVTNATPYELYRKLRSINPAPFASLINFGDGAIVSSSPERFIRIQDRQIETRPIKGTCPRGQTPEEDRNNKEQLLSSEKDQAELLMIVDLERNDIGRIATPGSVKVTELFHLETYPTVHHLVATIQGEIDQRYDVMDCIKATFPGGSITGAPKIRAMEIIDELEPTTRNIYTGSIGYIGFNQDVDLNIVIRTIVYKEGKAYFQVGGGIVWDSDPIAEYQETLDKAKAMIRVLQG